MPLAPPPTPLRRLRVGAEIVLIVFALALGLGALAVWSISEWSDYSDSVKDARVAADAAARLFEEHLQGIFDADDLVLRRLAVLGSRYGVDKIPAADWLLVLSESGRAPLMALWLLDSQGRPVLSSGPGPWPQARTAALDLARPRAAGGQTQVSPLLLQPGAADPAFLLVRRIESSSGAFLGTAVALVGTQHFTPFFNSLDLGPRSAICVHRVDRVLVIRQPFTPGSTNTDFPDTPVFQRICHGSPAGSLTAPSPFDGVERLMAYRRMDNPALIVMAGVSVKDALAGFWLRLIHNALFMLTGMVAGLTALLVALVALRHERDALRALSISHAGLEKRVEERTKDYRAALAEKDVLFRELHHRVKNNLQVITSLLRLEAARHDDPEVRQGYADSLERIRSMALVHEQLYRSKDFSRVDCRAYLEQLGEMLAASYQGGAVLTVEAEAINCDLDRAIPLAMIVTELVTNSLRHAVRPDGQGRVAIGLHRGEGGTVTLEVSDNGPGLAPDFRLGVVGQGGGLGLQLVPSLARQIDAEIEAVSHGRLGGASFRLTFRE